MSVVKKGLATSTVSVCNASIGRAVMRGVITQDAAAVFQRECASVALSIGAKGIIYRVDRSVVAFGPEANGDPALMPQAMQDTPAAFVVAPCDFELFEHYCRRAQRAGIGRRVFTDAERAEAWVRAQVEAWRVTGRMRAARTAHPARP